MVRRLGAGHGMCSWFKSKSMKIDQQRKIVCIMGASALVVIFASTAIAAKCDEYVNYVVWGGYIYAALLFVAAIFLIKKEKAA